MLAQPHGRDQRLSSYTFTKPSAGEEDHRDDDVEDIKAGRLVRPKSTEGKWLGRMTPLLQVSCVLQILGGQLKPGELFSIQN